ncbi:GrpB family protein [Flavobacterium sp. MC2016-06]|jgi:GrpB-like predicted nucleotidyltransferase (UPF0157 family)|uniref:GrpB family protein n=1 Tax=Flavobacterium sp. MC2016-06 TaxID=2676308 RepID=UPI0012BAF3B7|nr:GrpB family protein [Flavobacterium sp. MC2016-06]MBU3861111.1 GrpB family protein [Flavobacterium sp. MC2016-06]
MSKKIIELSKEEIAKLFPVELSTYKMEWKDIYENEKTTILNVLNDFILRIEHFGTE